MEDSDAFQNEQLLSPSYLEMLKIKQENKAFKRKDDFIFSILKEISSKSSCSLSVSLASIALKSYSSKQG